MRIRLFPCLALLVALGGCSFLASEDAPPFERAELRPLTSTEQAVIEADNGFGLRLFRTLHEAEPGQNLFISPLSVSMALGMTLNGAAGETRAAMEATLGKTGLSEEAINAAYRDLIDLLTRLDPEVRLDIANSIWYRQGFNVLPGFLDLNRTYFDAEVRGLDFRDPATVRVINNWVKEKTQGKIDRIIEQVAPDHMMYLINAIYFKGAWQYAFDRNATRDAPFHNLDGTSTTVPMMTLEGTLPVYGAEGFSAVDLPYGDSLFSMTIVLPAVGAERDVNALAASLDGATWEAWIRQLAPQKVKLLLPRFKLTYDASLKQALAKMGMEVAFTDDADFSRMTPERVRISDVLHKTFVEVNEEGTEAAAVTGVIIEVTSMPRTTVIEVNRPFLFFIRERHSGTILFMGKVLSLAS
ncbi:serpin family protein [Rhodocaloribacter litoris]|uniref:serpin family protein n=1 Tax=Rhodocaloribacter litoris TaxID=2558931 RepID=UPI00141F968A|nr:serpin family protein [Rhodocaloribacter litoris]QXD14207.1 serpin family protein [Rhodocaloribacter litoris]